MGWVECDRGWVECLWVDLSWVGCESVRLSVIIETSGSYRVAGQ